MNRSTLAAFIAGFALALVLAAVVFASQAPVAETATADSVAAAPVDPESVGVADPALDPANYELVVGYYVEGARHGWGVYFNYYEAALRVASRHGHFWKPSDAEVVASDVLSTGVPIFPDLPKGTQIGYVSTKDVDLPGDPDDWVIEEFVILEGPRAGDRIWRTSSPHFSVRKSIEMMRDSGEDNL